MNGERVALEHPAREFTNAEWQAWVHRQAWAQRR
jgi:hypothetical protein